MKNKIWHATEIALEEQNVLVYPTELFDGIIVQIKESGGKSANKLYLNEEEMELLIVKMKEMMNYVKE